MIRQCVSMKNKINLVRYTISFTLAALLQAGLAHAEGGCTDPQLGATVTTEHSITLNGKVVNYSATVGFLDITVDPTLFSQAFPTQTATKIAKGCIFYTAYQVHTAAGAPQRPLTFAFNGGPGSASLWLHMGALGPRIVNEGTDGTDAPLPFQLQDNRSDVDWFQRSTNRLYCGSVLWGLRGRRICSDLHPYLHG